jgi:hypothetical protein
MIASWICRRFGQVLVNLTRAGVIALLVTQIVSDAALGAGASRPDPLIDPEVRALVRAGRARVLVTLQVAETTDQAQRVEAIGRAQDAVLARLPAAHASVVRRYASIPLLALEIDATALRTLETMTDVVAGVKPDRTVTTQ